VRAATLGDTFVNGWEDHIYDLDLIREHLSASAAAIRAAVSDCLTEGTGPIGGYDHPILFLQHIIWHEGWHVGLISLGLRNASQEPTDVWEEENIWSEWRTEEW